MAVSVAEVMVTLIYMMIQDNDTFDWVAPCFCFLSINGCQHNIISYQPHTPAGPGLW